MAFFLLLSQKSVSGFFCEITGASNLELKKPRKLTRFTGISHPMTDSHGTIARYIYHRSMNFVDFYGVHVAKYTMNLPWIPSVLVHSKVGWLVGWLVVGDLQVYGCFQK